MNLCFTEIILCQYNCDVCLKTYQIPYSPTYELKLGDREDSVYSYYQMTISGKQNFKNPNINKDDIFEALEGYCSFLIWWLLIVGGFVQ